MGILLCEKKIRKFEEEMRAYGQKWVTFCTHTHTHTHTHATKLVVRIVAIFTRDGAEIILQDEDY